MHPSHPSPDGLSFNTMFKLFLKRQLLNKLKDEIGETQLCVNQGWQVNLWAENQKFIFLKFKLIIFCKIYQGPLRKSFTINESSIIQLLSGIVCAVSDIWMILMEICLIHLKALHNTFSYGKSVTYIDGSFAGLLSTEVWLSQIKRQEQSDSIEWGLYFNAWWKCLK